MRIEDLKKQPPLIELIVASGQKRVSPRTGFVHLFPEGEAADTIPLYENFCFAWALFRQKSGESVKMGKELISRLLPFQTGDGNFPVYLHDYPRCYDFQLSLKIAPILVYLLRFFSPVLGDLKGDIEKGLQKALFQTSAKPFWENRRRACLGLSLIDAEPDWEGFSPLDWTEWVITLQLAGKTHFTLPYDSSLQLWKGASRFDVQERSEPRPSPLEWILAQESLSSRLLRDHPHLLRCAPLFPFSYTPCEVPDSSFRYFWAGSTLHSLFASGTFFDLEEAPPPKGDLFEAVCYCDISPETTIWVEGKRGTVFDLGDEISISTPDRMVKLKFELKTGSGDFCGHIFPANRPSQICKGHEAYDWQIGVRTLRRSPKAGIALSFEIV